MLSRLSSASWGRDLWLAAQARNSATHSSAERSAAVSLSAVGSAASCSRYALSVWPCQAAFSRSRCTASGLNHVGALFTLKIAAARGVVEGEDKVSGPFSLAGKKRKEAGVGQARLNSQNATCLGRQVRHPSRRSFSSVVLALPPDEKGFHSLVPPRRAVAQSRRRDTLLLALPEPRALLLVPMPRSRVASVCGGADCQVPTRRACPAAPRSR